MYLNRDQLNGISLPNCMILGLLTCILFGWLAFAEYSERQKVFESTHSWLAAPGTVTENRFTRESGTFFSYDYSVGGKKLTGHKLYPDQSGNLTSILAEKAYAVGSPITVHYSPVNPTYAALVTYPWFGQFDPGKEFSCYLMALILGFGMLFHGIRNYPASKRQGLYYVRRW